MNSPKNKNKQGIVLLAVTIAMFLISILFMGSMTKGRLLATKSIRENQRTQFLWHCDAGIAQAVDRIYSGGSFPTSTTFPNNTIVTVALSSPTTDAKGNSVYTATSTASANGVVKRKISQKLTVEKATVFDKTNFTIHFGGITGGNKQTGKDATFIFGQNSHLGSADASLWDTFYVFGDLQQSGSKDPDMPNMTILSDGLYLDKNGNVTSYGSVTTGATISASTNIIEAIKKVMGDFQKATASTSDQYFNNQSLNINEGESIILQGSDGGDDVTVANLNITGDGTIIIKGNLTLGQNANLSISQKGKLIVQGNIIGENGSNFSVNNKEAVIYSGGSAVFKNNLNVQGTLLVEDYLIAKNGSASSTMIYCNDYIEFKNSATINGIVIAQQFIAENGINLKIDGNVVPNWLIDAIVKNMNGGTSTKSSVLDVTFSDWTLIQ